MRKMINSDGTIDYIGTSAEKDAVKASALAGTLDTLTGMLSAFSTFTVIDTGEVSEIDVWDGSDWNTY